jgi:phage terminase small subunit
MVEIAVGLHIQLIRIRRQLALLSEADVMVTSPTGVLHKHPLLSAQVETAGALRLAIAELGMSPVARTKLPKRSPTDVEDDISRDIGVSPLRRLRAVGDED